MIGVITVMCGVTVIGAIGEAVVKKENTKKVIKAGTYAIDGAIVAGLLVHAMRAVLKLYKELV